MSQSPLPVVISGIGVLSPLGTSRAAFFEFLSQNTADLPVEDTDAPLITRFDIRDPRFKIARYMDTVSKNAIVALGGALSDSGIDSEWIKADPYNYALVFGAEQGPLTTREMLYEGFEKKERKLLSGTLFSHCGYNMAAAMTAVAYGIKGPNLTFSAGLDTGIYLLRRAAQLLRSRRVHTVFVGFSELKKDQGSLKELAYLLVLEDKAHAVQRAVRQFVEFEEIACDASSLQPGKMHTGEYGCDLSQAVPLDDQVIEHRVAFEAYLPLVKLGMVAGHEQDRHFLMPARTKSGSSLIVLRSVKVHGI